MLLDLTVHHPDGARDVRVDATPGTAFGEVRAQLVRTLQLPAGTRFYAGDRRVDDAVALADSGLRCGGVLTLRPLAVTHARHPYSLRVSGGPDAGHVHPLPRGRLTVGRDATCDITLADTRISRRHATLEVTGTGVTVFDRASTNGTSVDSVAVPWTGAPLAPGSVLQLGDSVLSVVAPAVAPAVVSATEDGTVLVPRPPRPGRPGSPPPILWPAPARRDRPAAVQWTAALFPAAAAGGLAWASGSPDFLLFGLLSPVMMIFTGLGERWGGRRARRRCAAPYRDAIVAAAGELAEALTRETAERRSEFPDPAALALVAELPGVGLWQRGPQDDDWLVLRIGIAARTSRVRVREAGAERTGGLLAAVPVTLNLSVRPIGLAGPARTRHAVARWLVAQLVVHHSPEELALVVLSQDKAWRWTRWLPHARVITAPDNGTVTAELQAEVEHRLRRRDTGEGSNGPVTVLVVDGPVDAALGQLVERGRGVGLTALFLCAEVGALPGGCTAVETASDARLRIGDSGRRDSEHRADVDASEAVADTVTPEWADRVARALAPLVDARARRDERLPSTCSLGELIDIGTADDVARAGARSDGRADTVLGLSTGGPVIVDLESDGPHALVAGTTGSGKSELLRTLIVGLCLRHPPDALSVLLIDYKGGAAFAECAELPHCVGMVTDLDPHLTARALRTLQAEIRRRERALEDVGAMDLRAYRTAATGAPLARLVIVVDEFATLADELPDFVDGLVGVAQRGRSLGIHLVLATQRPGHAVSPEIRANTSLRIALRTVGPGESEDVIGSGDAAAIGPTTPGRALLRTGSGLQLFQSARPTAPAPRSAGPQVHALDGLRCLSPGSAEPPGWSPGLIEAARSAAAITGRQPARSPWLPPLPDLVPLESLPRSESFALLDLPDRQEQPGLDLGAATSTLVVGAAGSGRTTTLAAMALAFARTYDPTEAEIHLIDPTAGLIDLIGGLPHLGTRLGADDLDLTDRLLTLLAVGADRRRHALFVDGWDAVLATLGDDAGLSAAAEQALADLMRTPRRVRVAVSGGRALLAPRVSGAFDDRLVLRLADRGDYGSAGIAERELPPDMPAGRGIRAHDAAAFQVAVPRPRGTESVARALHRVAVAVDTARATRSSAPNSAPPSAAAPAAERFVLRPLPARVELRGCGPAGARLRLGVGGDGAGPVTLDPFAGSRRWLVAGPPRSGRSTVMSTALVEAERIGLRVLVAAASRSPVVGLAARYGVPVVDPGDRLLDDLRPSAPTLLLVDDVEAFVDSDVEDGLVRWVRDGRLELAVIVAGRTDELTLAYRGLAAEIRRHRTGVLLRPGPADGELLGVRVPRARPRDPVGRGQLVGDPAWSTDPAAPTRVQLAVATGC